MRIGIVRTAGSVCRCAETLAAALQTLGHEPLLADSEEIDLRAGELAERCSLVVDHTDTFRGRGRLRAMVRALLEARGARLVGSDTRACLLADDKVAAKAVMASAGVPTVPGAVVASPEWSHPAWLCPPLVVKPVFEHMSRGLCWASSVAEARCRALELMGATGQPVLVECYIPGRELGVCVLGGPRGVEVLPIVEADCADILTEGMKREDAEPGGQLWRPAGLSSAAWEEVSALALRAFEALGLRDYARFDVRMSDGGTPFFLEANVTPSFEPGEAIASSARLAGLDYPAFVERLLAAAQARHAGDAAPERSLRLDLPAGSLDLVIPPGVHAPPESSLALARYLDVAPGEDVLELGCGCGLLSLVAALRGARTVVATDLDPAALAATELNARRNGLGDRVQTRAGSWYEAVGNARGRFHVIIATPPQTPGLRPHGTRWGGFDGTRHLRAVAEGAPSRLDPSRGRLWLLALSTANPRALRHVLDNRFEDVQVAGQTDRVISPSEYDALEPGLFRHLLALRDSGRAEFRDDDQGRYVFRNLFLRAAGPRAP